MGEINCSCDSERYWEIIETLRPIITQRPETLYVVVANNALLRWEYQKRVEENCRKLLPLAIPPETFRRFARELMQTACVIYPALWPGPVLHLLVERLGWPAVQAFIFGQEGWVAQRLLPGLFVNNLPWLVATEECARRVKEAFHAIMPTIACRLATHFDQRAQN